jgi:hypothetical protein
MADPCVGTSRQEEHFKMAFKEVRGIDDAIVFRSMVAILGAINANY